MERIQILRGRLDKVQVVMARHASAEYSNKARRLAIKICKEINLEEAVLSVKRISFDLHEDCPACASGTDHCGY